jgi:hypothetical protein
MGISLGGLGGSGCSSTKKLCVWVALAYHPPSALLDCRTFSTCCGERNCRARNGNAQVTYTSWPLLDKPIVNESTDRSIVRILVLICSQYVALPKGMCCMLGWSCPLSCGAKKFVDVAATSCCYCRSQSAPVSTSLSEKSHHRTPASPANQVYPCSERHVPLPAKSMIAKTDESADGAWNQ